MLLTRCSVTPGYVAKKPALIVLIQVSGIGLYIACNRKYMMSFCFLNSHAEFIRCLFVMLLADTVMPLRLRCHIPLVRSCFPLVVSFLLSSYMIMIFSLVRCACMRLSNSFSSDINTLSFMAGNMWHDLSYKGFFIEL